MRTINKINTQQWVENQQKINLSVAAANALYKDKVDKVLEKVDYSKVLDNAQAILEQAKIESQLAEMFKWMESINVSPVNNTIELWWAINKVPVNNIKRLSWMKKAA